MICIGVQIEWLLFVAVCCSLLQLKSQGELQALLNVLSDIFQTDHWKYQRTQKENLPDPQLQPSPKLLLCWQSNSKRLQNHLGALFYWEVFKKRQNVKSHEVILKIFCFRKHYFVHIFCFGKQRIFYFYALESIKFVLSCHWWCWNGASKSNSFVDVWVDVLKMPYMGIF